MKAATVGWRRFAPPAAARPRDGGMVTAELAVAIPTLLLVLSVCLGVVSVVTTRLRCMDAAAVAARLAARGEASETVRAETGALVPRAAVDVRRSAPGFVAVDVRQRVRLPVVGLLLPGVTVAAHLVVPDDTAPVAPFGAPR